MIFLSHNVKDKDFVGPIAQNLKDIYGKDNIFFDTWSIKPGENIIEEMSKGLEKCKFFFYFITENSLNSEMVKLEWTSALKRKSTHKIAFIPIKADHKEPPVIISAINYLDLYTNGLETTLLQIKEIIEEEDKEKTYPAFKNIEAYALLKDQDDFKLELYVNAKKFYEPNCQFGFCTTIKEDEATFEFEEPMVFTGFQENGITYNGTPLNVFLTKVEGGLAKGFRRKIVLKIKENVTVKPNDIKFVHIKTESEITELDVTHINSISELPSL